MAWAADMFGRQENNDCGELKGEICYLKIYGTPVALMSTQIMRYFQYCHTRRKIIDEERRKTCYEGLEKGYLLYFQQ